MTTRLPVCLCVSLAVALASFGCVPGGSGGGGGQTSCPSGGIPFSGRVFDACEVLNTGDNVPLDGVQISTLQPYSTTVSSDGGLFAACLPPGQPTTLEFTKSGYVTTDLAEFSLTAPLPAGNSVGLMLFCSSSYQNYAAEDPLLDRAKGVVFALVTPALASGVTECDAGYNAPGQLDGWSFSASLPDGSAGAGAPWPTGYVDQSGTFQAVESTFDTGVAILFNIDPAAQYVTLHGVNPSLGVEWPAIDNALGLTGRVHVAAGAFGYDPWIVPGLADLQCPATTSLGTQGSCPATGPCTLASAQSAPLSVAVSATGIYWTNEGSGEVLTVPLGGGNITTLATGYHHPLGVAVDQTSVYWVDYDGSVMKVPLAGGTPTTLASNQHGPNSLAIDSHNVYWTNYLDGTVMKVPLGGGTPTTLATNQASPNSLAVDSANLYWTNSGTAANGYLDGQVHRLSFSSGNVTALVAAQAGPLGIAVDATSVYWADASGTIMKIPLGGGAPTTLASGQSTPSAVAVDASNVYWTSFTDPGAIFSVALQGGAVTTLATGRNAPDALAVDATHVYWTEWGGGTVMLAPKSAPGSSSTSGGSSSTASSSTSGGSGPGSTGGASSGGSASSAGSTGGSSSASSAGSTGGSSSASSAGSTGGSSSGSSSSTNGGGNSGGTSSGGVEEVVLAFGQNAPVGIALDNAGCVYWTTEGSADAGYTDGTVMKIQIDGGGLTPLAVGRNYPQGIAVDSNNVYWVEGTGPKPVMEVSNGGGSPLPLASGQDLALAVAVDSNRVYWTSTYAGQVSSVPLDGGVVTTIYNQYYPWGLAVGGGNLYWANEGSIYGPGGVMVAPGDGGAPYALVSVTGSSPLGLAVDANNVYWTDQYTPGGTANSTVMSQSLGGGTPALLASAQYSPAAIAVDATTVYWRNGGTISGTQATLMSVSLDGGTPKTLAAVGPFINPGTIAVDATSIYWTEIVDGTVMKLTPK